LSCEGGAELPPFAATGVGSLPGTDPAAAAELVLRHCPHLPYWPQLPARGPDEAMLWQFLPRVRHLPAQAAWEGSTGLSGREPERWLQGEPGGLEAPADSAPGIEALLAEPAMRGAAWVKGQVTGPVTAALGLRDRAGRPLAERPELHGLLGGRLLEAALRQGRRLAGAARRVLLFVDEPLLFRLPEGEAGRSLLDELTRVLAALREAGLRAGLHTCGPPDWPLLCGLGAQVLGFDAWRYLPGPEARKPLAMFLDRGGSIAWGLVPVQAELPALETLESRAREALACVGPEGAARSLLTPSCGLAALAVAEAGEAHGLTAALGERLRASADA
jgi:hypothetical protein